MATLIEEDPIRPTYYNIILLYYIVITKKYRNERSRE